MPSSLILCPSVSLSPFSESIDLPSSFAPSYLKASEADESISSALRAGLDPRSWVQGQSQAMERRVSKAARGSVLQDELASGTYSLISFAACFSDVYLGVDGAHGVLVPDRGSLQDLVWPDGE